MKIRNKVTRSGVLALVMASIGVAGAAMTPSIASADDSGPVVYLSRHGWPTLCTIYVDAYGVDSSGKPFGTSHLFERASCDGTLQLPKGTQQIHFNDAESLGDADYNPIDEWVYDVRDDWAYCLLTSTTGQIRYTNASPKGGDCNGD